jgi:hypothetical protein
MEEHTRSRQLASPGLWSENGFGSLGLSEDDLSHLTGIVGLAAADWHIDVREDAFNQTSLIIARSKSNRLQLALIVSRIGTGYFLDEVRAANCDQIGAFSSLAELVVHLRVRLVRWSGERGKGGTGPRSNGAGMYVQARPRPLDPGDEAELSGLAVMPLPWHFLEPLGCGRGIMTGAVCKIRSQHRARLRPDWRP